MSLTIVSVTIPPAGTSIIVELATPSPPVSPSTGVTGVLPASPGTGPFGTDIRSDVLDHCNSTGATQITLYLNMTILSTDTGWGIRVISGNNLRDAASSALPQVYTVGVNNSIQTSGGTPAASPLAAIVRPSGKAITVDFTTSHPNMSPSTGITGFSLSGTSVTVSQVWRTGNKQITIVPSSELSPSDSITVNYNSSTGNLTDLGGTPVVTFSLSATNSVASDTSVYKLHSRPSASAKLYLEFNGQPDIDWELGIATAIPAYSGTNLNCLSIWRILSERYSPFDIDITTEDPNSLVYGTTCKQVYGGTSPSGPSVGGTTPIGGFAGNATGSNQNISFVYSATAGVNADPLICAEIGIHEAGHLFGLNHALASGDSNVSPIMNATLTMSTRRIWATGSRDIGGSQSDVDIISNITNGFGYASSALGLIRTISDSCTHTISHTGGNLTVIASPSVYSSALDLKITVKDNTNTIVGSADSGSLGETVVVNSASAGTYTAIIESHGTYGDIGQYTFFASSSSGGLISSLHLIKPLVRFQSIDFIHPIFNS